MSNAPEFIARRVEAKFGQPAHWSLRFRQNGRNAGNEWGKLYSRHGEWRTWGDTEDMGRVMRASIYEVRRATLAEALAACRTAFERYHAEMQPSQQTESAEDAVVYAQIDADEVANAMYGDATGPGQDWDANHGFDH